MFFAQNGASYTYPLERQNCTKNVLFNTKIPVYLFLKSIFNYFQNTCFVNFFIKMEASNIIYFFIIYFLFSYFLFINIFSSSIIFLTNYLFLNNSVIFSLVHVT